MFFVCNICLTDVILQDSAGFETDVAVLGQGTSTLKCLPFVL